MNKRDIMPGEARYSPYRRKNSAPEVILMLSKHKNPPFFNLASINIHTTNKNPGGFYSAGEAAT